MLVHILGPQKTYNVKDGKYDTIVCPGLLQIVNMFQR